MQIQALTNNNSIMPQTNLNSNSIEQERKQFLTMAQQAAEQMAHLTPGSFEFQEYAKLVKHAEKAAHILKEAIKYHGGVLSHHETHRLNEVMNAVNNQCWNILDHSTSGENNPLYTSMVNLYWLCHSVLNPTNNFNKLY